LAEREAFSRGGSLVTLHAVFKRGARTGLRLERIALEKDSPVQCVDATVASGARVR
jgi:hypothetical protein